MAKSSRRAESYRYWYLVLVPLLAILTLVEFYPLVDGVRLSLTGSSGQLSLSNYSQMLTDRSFWSAVSVSLAYTIGSTVICIALGLGLTYLVTQKVRGRGYFEAIYVFPLATAPIVVGTLWSPSSTWDDIQSFLHFILHQPYFNELSIGFFFPVMVFSEAWEWAPLVMLVALSIINSQSPQIFEAAELHGASALQKFRMVGLPMVLRSPVMQFVIVLRMIDAMGSFAIPLSWSNWVGYPYNVGSPVDTLSLFMYKLIFIPEYGFPIGLVSAVAVALLAVTLVVAFVLIRMMGRALPLSGGG
ncbi:MAG: sugar ABC transporter permease [Nitrososphaerota archaeon]|nr:sugar ABC transporter permease [Nitrososphaerota archaeon]MDG6979426.1 sugar ABC transporter permease [Nitrososphaerota archaeon]